MTYGRHKPKPPVPVPTPPPSGGYLFVDEFDGPAGSPPDPAKWVYDVGGGGWGNDELETYTSSTANCFQDGNSNLVIRADRAGIGGYSSARIKTLGKYAQVGRTWEVRARIKSQQGLWPAIWFMGDDVETVGWPACGEVDLVEDFGWDFTETTVHVPDGSGGVIPVVKGQTYVDQPGDTAWHTWRMYSDVSGFVFHRDGVEYLYVVSAYPRWPYTVRSLFMLINLAVGGTGGGPVPASAVFPVDLMVDYVHAW